MRAKQRQGYNDSRHAAKSGPWSLSSSRPAGARRRAEHVARFVAITLAQLIGTEVPGSDLKAGSILTPGVGSGGALGSFALTLRPASDRVQPGGAAPRATRSPASPGKHFNATDNRGGSP